ncbi:hypothetical protein [Nitrosopumilus sp.]|uniref:hypothetical protein n=1 Tax=Nitrosopumilus sp. TaxID=2024843 RepID=UPI0034A087A4
MNEKTMMQNDVKHISRNNTDSKTTSKNQPNPTLGTIRMVEETLFEMSEYPTKNKLWRALPRQIQYPSFKEILKYLEESNKLITDKDGSLIWIFANTEKQKKLREETKSLL